MPPVVQPGSAELLAGLRAAQAAVAAWLAAPTAAAWHELRRQLAAMDALIPLCAASPADAELGREVERYCHRLTGLRDRLAAWQTELSLRREQLRQAQPRLTRLRAWQQTLQSTAP